MYQIIGELNALRKEIHAMDTRLAALQSAQAQLATDVAALIAQGAPIPAADIQTLVDNTNTLDVQVKDALIPPVAPVA